MLVERVKAYSGLVRLRYTAQIVGIVTIVSLKSSMDLSQLIPTVTSILFLAASLFLLDDARDHRSDALVHPKRAIPKGKVGPRTVYLAGTALLVLGFATACLLPVIQLLFFVAMVSLGLIVIFSPLGSTVRSVLAALMIWSLFPFGSGSNSPDSYFFGLMIGLPHVGGSIAKGFIHWQGDREVGLPPPGESSRYMASSSFFSSSVIVWIPVLLNLVSWTYMLFIFPTFLCSILMGIEVLYRRYSKVYLYGAIGMVSALAAFIFDLN